MIAQSTDCYLVARLEGEAASNLAFQLSPAASLDIVQATVTSALFENDIEGLSFFDTAAATLKALAQVPPGEETEEINPLYLPCQMEKVDELLDIDVKRDAYEFSGLDGNPFTLKFLSAGVEGARLEVALRFRPFQLPGYSELAEAHRLVSIN